MKTMIFALTKKRETMIFDLPRDLVEEILSRVPWKSKKAVRLTCKKWNTYLTKMHQLKLAAKAKEGESQIIVLMNNDLYLKSVVVNENPSTKTLGKLTGLNEKVKKSIVFHCEGLLLFILDNHKDDYKIVVWNPYLGQTRWIEPPQGEDGCFTDWYTYALGYVNKKNNKSCRCHKIMRFCDFPHSGKRQLLYEIYDFDSDLWKTLDVSSDWHLPYYQCGISLKGNTYWCASLGEEYIYDHIICFDFTRERFGPLLRFPFKRNDNSVTLSCVREEKLAALVSHWKRNPNEIDIWITTKIEATNVLWSKFLTLDTGSPDCLLSLGSFIDEEKKVIMCIDTGKGTSTLRIIGEAGYLRKLELGECEKKSSKGTSTLVCSYVPSLVQIKKHARRGGKRNKQSDLEKHRNGEKRQTLWPYLALFFGLLLGFYVHIVVLRP